MIYWCGVQPKFCLKTRFSRNGPTCATLARSTVLMVACKCAAIYARRQRTFHGAMMRRVFGIGLCVGSGCGAAVNGVTAPVCIITALPHRNTAERNHAERADAEMSAPRAPVSRARVPI